MASDPCGVTSVSVHEDDPAAGSCDTNTESEAPPTMQKARLAHETLSSIIEPASLVIFHALAPPVGSVDVTTSP